MDFETAATKNTITTAEEDDAADVTDNEDAAEASTTKNEEAITKSYIFIYRWTNPRRGTFSCDTYERASLRLHWEQDDEAFSSQEKEMYK